MQTQNNQACSQAVSKLKEYLDCISAKLKPGVELTCMYSGECIEILAASKKAMQIAKIVKDKLHLFTYGVHVARYCDNRIIVNLGLLGIIGGYSSHYVRVTDHGERLFLYGRDIFEDSIIEIKVSKECTGKPVLVVNTRGEPLGWGRYRRRKGRIIIENIIDLGWYLRSGV